MILIAALLSWPGLGNADEVWETGHGQMTYLADLGDVAIWETENLDGTMRLYFPGLAGNFDQRSVHDGYWIQYAG